MNRITLLINICLLLISCSGRQDSAYKNTIRYNASNGVTSLDPAFASNQDNIWATSQIFDGLVTLSGDLEPIPAIAEKWEILDSGLTYVFHLREDVFFHEHPSFSKPRKVTAKDFIFSFRRIMDPETASPGAWIFNDKLADNPFSAPDDHTLVIRLRRPFPPFLSLLSMVYCSVLPSDLVLSGVDPGRNPVGTGPFVFHQWEEDVKLILHRNPNYYESTDSRPVPRIDALSISFIRSRESAFLEFMQGKLDFAGEIDPGFRPELLNSNGQLNNEYRKDLKLFRSPFLNTEYLAIYLDTDSSSPMAYSDFRKALNMAIDKADMIRYLRWGIGIPATGSFVPPGLPGSFANHPTGFEYDKKKALQLLDLVPKEIRDKPIVLTTTKDYEDLCIYIQGQWKQIGIETSIEVLPSSSLKDAKRNGKLAFFRASWIADYADAENYLSCFTSQNHSPGGPNYTHYSSQRFDSLYNVALKENDHQTRAGLYRTMDSMIVGYGAIIPLYYDETAWLTRSSIDSVYTSPLNIPKFKYMVKPVQ